ncbi:MAG: cysteine desulfurase NifS [Thermodesulfobacteriota bacterium]|nr:cysteine desulfurase NifS [Thermodesulfobacteriota bacterium]
MERVYFDNNATTPVSPIVLEALLPYYQSLFGNPSSLHWAGREVSGAIDSARAQVAALINSEPEEIIFTASGSEGDNLAILGSCDALRHRGNHIVTTVVEHPAVLDTCRYFEERGGQVTYLPVDSYGMIDLQQLEDAITPQTILISVMWANNETGTIFPIQQIGEIARRHKVQFHCDAVQAIGKVPIDMLTCHVDLLVISGHKIGAPKGVGAVYIRRGTALTAHIHGGQQENALRAGTHNVAGIVAMGKACQLAADDLSERVDDLKRLRDRLQQGIIAVIADVTLHGHPEQRLPNTLNLGFSFIEGEGLLLHLDMYGIAASSGSACSSESDGASHVLSAMAVDELLLNSSIRFSLGYHNTVEEVDKVLEVLPAIVAKLREMSPMLSDGVDLGECPFVECSIDPH